MPAGAYARDVDGMVCQFAFLADDQVETTARGEVVDSRIGEQTVDLVFGEAGRARAYHQDVTVRVGAALTSGEAAT
jgi:hypothetical protein